AQGGGVDAGERPDLRPPHAPLLHRPPDLPRPSRARRRLAGLVEGAVGLPAPSPRRAPQVPRCGAALVPVEDPAVRGAERLRPGARRPRRRRPRPLRRDLRRRLALALRAGLRGRPEGLLAAFWLLVAMGIWS